ncbi:MAG: FlgD immunoglobulin-like domain containing protein, partial [Spirochaetota bacterium]|nr:FlgD immunoglobulin-like domain containing protein [Spirochaetota bacterium]
MKKKETALFVLFLTVIFVCSLGAAENDAKIMEFTSPKILGTGAAGSVLLPPQTSLINPASAALAQRITFDGSYVGLIGTDGDTSGWKGHVINFGHTIPTKVGVFTWNGSFLTSSFESMDTGSQFGLSGSFAKDIYPDTFIGIGLKTAIADGPQYTAAADIGLIRTRPEVWFLDDVQWSIALQNLGYSDIEAVRAPLYTLTAGINGEMFGNDRMSGRLIGDVSWVEFTNVRCSAGINLTIGEFFNVGIGSRLDVQKVLDGDPGELIPSISMSYTYIPGDKEGERWTQNELQPYAAAAPLSSELWAASVGLTVPIGRIDEEAPEIEIDLSDLIGQQESDGQQEAPEEGDEQNEDKVSQLIRMGEDKEPSAALFMLVSDEAELPGKSVLDKAAVEGETDGSAEENGDPSEEESIPGVKTGVDEFTSEELKNEMPEAQIYLSPNNDGVKDSLSFPLKISEGRYIKGYEFIVEDENGNRIRTIENKETRPEKRTVRTFFQNLFKAKSGIQVPETIRWDGTTDTGETAPDGLYRFYIRAWDDNENYGTTDTYSIYIDTQPPVVEIEKAEEQDRIFSPNDDGKKDVLPIEQAGTTEDTWEAVFNDANGNPVSTRRWNDSGPLSFEWDGTNDEGILVPDGVYQYRISSTDRAGNTGSAEYLNLVKNTEETPITLTIDNSHFSPNGDGVLDVVLLEPDVPVVSGVTRWELTIKDSDGRARRVYRGRTAPTGTTAF